MIAKGAKEAEEKVQLVKCFLCKHEDQGSITSPIYIKNQTKFDDLSSFSRIHIKVKGENQFHKVIL